MAFPLKKFVNQLPSFLAICTLLFAINSFALKEDSPDDQKYEDIEKIVVSSLNKQAPELKKFRVPPATLIVKNQNLPQALSTGLKSILTEYFESSSANKSIPLPKKTMGSTLVYVDMFSADGESNPNLLFFQISILKGKMKNKKAEFGVTIKIEQ